MTPTPSYRITLFVPSNFTEAILKAVQDTTVLRLGNYGDVTWTSSEGTERFTPLEGSSPETGKIGVAEELASRQIIFSIPRDKTGLEKVLTAIRSKHPWENPVIYVDETELFV